MIFQYKRSLMVMALLMLMGAEASARRVPFNSKWKFLRDSLTAVHVPFLDDPRWTTVDLPHDYSIMPLSGPDTEDKIGPFSKQSPGGNNTGHVMGGTGWYSKEFIVDKQDKGRRFTLLFDGVYNQSTVWVNGKKMGEHKYGYTPFYYDITDALYMPGKPNNITVKVENNGSNSRWYSGSGIYRNVQLLITEPQHTDVWGVYVTTPEVSADHARAHVEMSLQNASPKSCNLKVVSRILDPQGHEVAVAEQKVDFGPASQQTVSRDLDISHPLLWDLDHPNMYRAEICLMDGKRVVDLREQPFGIRTISFSAEKGFQLNGKRVILEGGCVHHDNGFLGAAAIDRAEYRRVELLKKNGYNAIRCSHNPPSETFLNACDELGMLVIDEFTDMWTVYKNHQDYSLYFKECWEGDLTSMLLRDRNHPSIIMWSIGNEVPKMNIAEGVELGRMLRDKVKSLDLTRVVTEGVPGFIIHGGWKNTKDYFAVLDVCGYNYMRSKYKSDHELYPNRIMYASEAYPGQMYDDRKAANDLPYVIGNFVWTAMDYIGEVLVANSKYVKNVETRSFQERDGIAMDVDPHRVYDMMARYASPTWPAYNAWCGDLDIIGEKKPQGRYRDVMWDLSPVEINVHEPIPDSLHEQITMWGWPHELPSWTWQGCEGKVLQVRVFTKAPELRLELNDEVVGTRRLTADDKYIATFEVPYRVGKLTAVALKEGKEVGRKQLVTVGQPVRLRLTVDRSTIKADRSDLAFVRIDALDVNGNIVITDNSRVEISVDGCGERVASGNASPDDMKSVNCSEINLFRGQGQIVVRPFERKGEISIMVTSLGMTNGRTIIRVD